MYVYTCVYIHIYVYICVYIHTLKVYQCLGGILTGTDEGHALQLIWFHLPLKLSSFLSPLSLFGFIGLFQFPTATANFHTATNVFVMPLNPHNGFLSALFMPFWL